MPAAISSPSCPRATPGLVLRLSAGTYHVISRYGAINAVVRADIEVEAGKLTEAVMRHAGAEATLKLVSEEGGEALANTSWTVITEAGATVHESVGAFPSLILAEGNYTAVADHQGKIYSRDFTIEPGVNRDIEVRLSDFVPPADQAGQPSARPRPAYGAVGRRSGGNASAARACSAASRLKVSCSLPPSRRSETVPSSASRRPTTSITGTFATECSRTL